ncbi:MAG: hypothetical protein ACLTDM_06985 [Clostridium butyricum]
MKHLRLLIMTIMLSMLFIGCETPPPKEPVVNEYELVSISFFNKVKTNTFGRVISDERYLRYSFMYNNKIITKEQPYDSSYDENKYRIYKSEDGKSKIVQIDLNDELDFYLNDEMLKNLK